MKLHWIDITILVVYLLGIAVIGFVLKRKAAKNLKAYLLGGNELPWYMLALSNAHGMFDISGTMWLVTILFVYGLKSVWLPWLWPTFNQIFLMVYLSQWLRRSNVTTGAQWIETQVRPRAGLAAVAHDRRDLRPDRLPQLPGLRVRRAGQVHRDLHPLERRVALRAVPRCPRSMCRTSTGSPSRWWRSRTRSWGGCRASSGPTWCSTR